MTPPRLSLLELLDRFTAGASVYVQGASGEHDGLRRALEADPQRLAGVELVSCLVPGINTFDYAALHGKARLSTFLLPPPLRPSFEAGRVRVFPLAYSAIAQHLWDLAPDVAILNLTPPDGEGRCSFGPCADFGPIVAETAKVKIGLLNAALPRPRIGPTLPVEALDAVVEFDAPLACAPPGRPAPVLERIAAHVAALIPDGAVIQTGIGQAPAAIWAALQGHRGLHLYSGLVTDGFLQASDAGALATNGHIAGVAFGSADLYARLDGNGALGFADVRATHGRGVANLDRFFAINSGLELDLFGQANLEWLDGRLVSGVGGAPDFGRAARASRGGRSILALPSSARSGAVSRIVPRLTAPSVSLPRDVVDTVVTEHGAAALGALSLDTRAEALIGVAEPQHRDALARAWREMRNGH